MSETNAVNNVKIKIRHFKDKANHNKKEALWGFKLVMASTVAVPLFIALGADDVWSKYVPAVLSSFSAFGTAWLQLRKPNQLWTLYRTTERRLEYQLDLYQFNAGKYKDCDDKEAALIEEVSNICITTNSSWVELVPNEKELHKLKPKKGQ